MIIIKNLTKKFGDIFAVKKLSLEVEAGRIFSFLGPNAAGKTTTIKILMRLLFPTEGKVVIKNIESNRKNSFRLNKIIGYVPEEPILYEKLTTEEFLYFICTAYEMEKNAIEEKINHYLHLFHIWETRNKFIETFSKGTKKKISIISALIHEPEILILDEPAEGLDPRMVYLLKKLLIEERDKRRTIFLSTHILQIAEELCDCVAIIDKGNLLFNGTMEELRKFGEKPDANLEELFLKLTDEEEVKGS